MKRAPYHYGDINRDNAAMAEHNFQLIQENDELRAEVESLRSRADSNQQTIERLREALANLYGFLKTMPASRLRFGDEDAVTYTMLMDAARAAIDKE